MKELIAFSFFLGLSYAISPELVNQIKQEASTIPKPKLSEEFQVQQVAIPGRVAYVSYNKPVFFGTLDQKDQEIIVLNQQEDGVDICGEKNTHVVLIKNGNEYRVLYAYTRTRGPNVFIEWERYTPRGGSAVNKAYIFGHYLCTKSLFTSCKQMRMHSQLLNEKNIHGHDQRSEKVDFFCDLSNTKEEAMFSGAILSTLNMDVTILAGADVIYKDEMKIQKDVIRYLMEEKKKQLGRSFKVASSSTLQNIVESAANKFIDQGQGALSTGVLMFYVLVGTIGQVAESLLHMDNKQIRDDPEFEEFKAEMRKNLGAKLLEGLFAGSYDLREYRVNQHPGLLLKEKIARQIATGRQEAAEDETEISNNTPAPVGRGLFGGRAGKGGNKGTRNYYNNPVKDGTSTGLRATSNLNAVMDNAVGKGKESKSAGQIFSDNVKNGFHVPYGLVEDVGDTVGVLAGVGKINDDQTVVDKTFDGIINVASGTLGQVVDVAADVLSPFGLGPLAKIVAGVGGGVLGIAAGGVSCEKVCGPHQLIKLGGALLLGRKKKKKIQNPNVQIDADLEKQFLEMYYSQDEQLEIPQLALQPQPVIPLVAVQQPPMAVGVAMPQQPPMAVGVAMPQQPPMVTGVAMPQQPPMAGMPQQPPAFPQYQQQGVIGQTQPGMLPQGQAPNFGQQSQGVALSGNVQTQEGGTLMANKGLPLSLGTQLDIFSIWGWLSQDISVIQLSQVTQEQDVFYGFGTANLDVKNHYATIRTYDELINFFLILLKIEYRDELRAQIIYLIQNNYVRYDETQKVFYLIETSLILKEKNLSPNEETILYLSMELVAFSHAYKDFADQTILLNSPSGQKISKSVAVVQLMTMRYVSLVFKYGDTHVVKLIRNYGLTLKTFFTKAMQDVYRYNTCGKCSSELIGLADNGAIAIYGMIQFTLIGSWDFYIDAWAKQARPDFDIPRIVVWYESYFQAKYAELISQVANYIV